MLQKKIILYEQHKGVRFVLERSLSKIDKEIDIISSHSKDIIKHYLKKGSVDLLITDLEASNHNGVGLSILARKTLPDLNIIWTTVLGCDLFIKEKNNLGNIICIEKPLDIKSFRKTVLNALYQESH
jgi:DNA-binding NtrC family response regulator